MTIIQTTLLNPVQKKSIYELWNQEYPEQLRFANRLALDAYLIILQDQQHYFLTNAQEQIIGWAFTFSREQGKWFAIIVKENEQKKGYGALLLDKLMAEAKELNGWVIDREDLKKSNGKTYKSPLAFYLKSKFSLCSKFRLENEKVSAVKITWKCE